MPLSTQGRKKLRGENSALVELIEHEKFAHWGRMPPEQPHYAHIPNLLIFSITYGKNVLHGWRYPNSAYIIGGTCKDEIKGP